MIWWCRTRRAFLLLPAGLGSLALLALLVGDSVAALPSFTVSGSGQTALMLFVPLPLIAALALCLDSRLPAAEAAGSRPVPALDAALTALVLLSAVVICLAIGLPTDSGTVVSAGRTTVFLTGLMLCARPWVGEPAALVPVAWLMAVVLVGFRGPRDPYPWTVIAEPPGAPHAALATAVVVLAGLSAQLWAPRSIT